MQKQQNSLIAGLRATNNAAVPPQDVEKGKEEKGKEVSIDREEEIETKVCFIILHLRLIANSLNINIYFL